MPKNIKIRWYSRAGQGAITASSSIAQILGQQKNTFTQSFSEFGAEKRGSPVTVFTRISSHPIETVHQIQIADFAILFDQTLLNDAELSINTIINNLNQNGHLLINGKNNFSQFSIFKGKLWQIDAKKIALEELGRNIPNIAIVAAFLKISHLFSSVEFKKNLKKVLQKLPPKIIQANLKAFDRGYNEVKPIIY